MRGIKTFRTYFSSYENQYVLIGGAACDILFDGAGQDFRATQDLDIVLIIENLTVNFGNRFWEFIREGNYKNKGKSNGSPQFFRFTDPTDESYPKEIELFSRSGTSLDDSENICVPLHIDDELSSLSAILLDKAYYNLLLNGRHTLSNISLLKAEYLILFKAKAWLDLSGRSGTDSRKIKKHKNDILRLATLLREQAQIDIKDDVKADINEFIERNENATIDLKDLGIQGMSYFEIIMLLKSIYIL